MKFLVLAAVPILLAAACSGGDGLERIQRLNLEDVDLQPIDLFEPSYPNPYPDVVATVNGEDITNEDLAMRQVSWELARISASEAAETLGEAALAHIKSNDPLESVIDDALLRQAVVRLGLLPTYEEAVDYTRKQEENALIVEASADPDMVEEAREFRRLSGFPVEGWASSEEVVDNYRESMGTIALRQQECAPVATPTPPGLFGAGGLDCPAFLAEERENAEIEYFVVWAE